MSKARASTTDRPTGAVSSFHHGTSRTAVPSGVWQKVNSYPCQR